MMRGRLAAALFILGTAARPQEAPQVTAATLAGVVLDTLGRAIPSVEITIPQINRSVRTAESGRFEITGVRPGRYEVWIRRLGYASVTYQWDAAAGGRVDIAAQLVPLPTTLDAVRIHEQERRQLRGRTIITGFVVDNAGRPIGDAELQLLGDGRSTLTAPNGTFTFRHVVAGPLTIRVRRIGLEPVVVRTRVADNEERTLSIQMRWLPTTLSRVVIRERSGYGEGEAVWQEFDRRRRWSSASGTRYLDRTDLTKFGKANLESVWQESGARMIGTNRGPKAITSINTAGRRDRPTFSEAGDMCILVNGRQPTMQPLRSFGADQVMAVEFIAANSDLSGTLRDRFASLASCAGEGLKHPPYVVVWLNDSP